MTRVTLAGLLLAILIGGWLAFFCWKSYTSARSTWKRQDRRYRQADEQRAKRAAKVESRGG